MTVKKSLAGLFLLPLLLLIGVFAFASALLARPELFITPNVVERAVHKFGRSYDPQWQGLAFKVHSLSLRNKEISFQASDFCFKEADGSVKGCFKNIEGQFTVKLYMFGLKLVRISNLRVDGDPIVITSMEIPSTKTNHSLMEWLRTLPALFQGVRVERLSVDLPKVKLVDKKQLAYLDVKLLADPTKERSWDMMGTLQGNGLKVNFKVKANRNPNSTVVTLTTTALKGKWTLKGSAIGTVTTKNYVLKGSLQLSEPSGLIRSIVVGPFIAEAALDGTSVVPESARFESGFHMEPVYFDQKASAHLPANLSGQLIARVRSTPKLFEQDHFDANVSVKFTPYMRWYEARGSIQTSASGRISQLQDVKITHDINLQFLISKFQNVVALLSKTSFAIPAPLDMFDGLVQLSIRSQGKSLLKRQTVAYTVLSDLRGNNGKLKFRVNGSLDMDKPWEPDRSIKGKTDVVMDDVVLQLPHLEATKMPAVQLDPRIVTAEQMAEQERKSKPTNAGRTLISSASVHLDLTVTTRRPVLIYSDLAKGAVAMTLNLRGEGFPPMFSGIIQTQPFRVEFFRRVALVDHVKLTRIPGSADFDLDALIVYWADEAVIKVRVLGSVDKPQVVLESDPPMSQQEILALLLFNKSPDELDPDEQSTVANTQSGIGEESFGLASLYLFASTPIEYVGYDPVTRTYTAKFRVPGGATLGIGSSPDPTEGKSVQLRKRIASHLAVQTEARNSPTFGNSITTFLEWFIRY